MSVPQTRIYTGIPLPPDGVLRKRAARLGYRVWPFGGVDVAVGVDGHAFARRALIHPVVAFERRDEPGDAVLVDRADPDALTPVRVVVWARLGVDHVDHVAPDKDATRRRVAVLALFASQQIAPKGEAAARWKARLPVITPMRPPADTASVR